VAHVQNIYLGGIVSRKHWAADDHVLRRAVLAYLLAHQVDPEAGVSVREAALTTGYDVARITGLLEPTPSTSGMHYQPSYERVDAKAWGAHRMTYKARIRARMCPWCQSRMATHVLRVPECPDDLLCTSCQRMPSDPCVVFPDEYMKLWVGGNAGHDQPTIERRTADTTATLEIEVPAAWKMRRRRAS
jgi:hypothetical protein